MSFDESLLSAYVDGELTPAERAEVEAALEAQPRYRQRVAELRAVQQAVGGLPPKVPSRDPAIAVRQRIDAMRAARAAEAGSSAQAGSSKHDGLSEHHGAEGPAGRWHARHGAAERRWYRPSEGVHRRTWIAGGALSGALLVLLALLWRPVARELASAPEPLSRSAQPMAGPVGASAPAAAESEAADFAAADSELAFVPQAAPPPAEADAAMARPRFDDPLDGETLRSSPKRLAPAAPPQQATESVEGLGRALREVEDDDAVANRLNDASPPASRFAGEPARPLSRDRGDEDFSPPARTLYFYFNQPLPAAADALSRDRTRGATEESDLAEELAEGAEKATDRTLDRGDDLSVAEAAGGMAGMGGGMGGMGIARENDTGWGGFPESAAAQGMAVIEVPAEHAEATLGWLTLEMGRNGVVIREPRPSYSASGAPGGGAPAKASSWYLGDGRGEAEAESRLRSRGLPSDRPGDERPPGEREPDVGVAAPLRIVLAADPDSLRELLDRLQHRADRLGGRLRPLSGERLSRSPGGAGIDAERTAGEPPMQLGLELPAASEAPGESAEVEPTSVP